eukprot:TRINITY_DN527_c0_g2_i1.p1 TRINITY_DN527_c0_g2~~TRINITY_DN527_c0_g2_i1.p1  ORF type:complete len:154 (-),score=21.51 TRINITY_DN527_c0_g2_i1:50-511(-)
MLNPSTLLRNVDKEYAYVLGGCVLSGVVLQMIGFRVGSARAKVKLDYPAMYFDREEAEKDKEKKTFNCVQRGHQNLLETYTSQLFFFLISGLKFPLLTAFATLLYSVGAWSFATGYATGIPKNRYAGLGVLVRLTSIVTFATSLYTLYTVIAK